MFSWWRARTEVRTLISTGKKYKSHIQHLISMHMNILRFIYSCSAKLNTKSRGCFLKLMVLVWVALVEHICWNVDQGSDKLGLWAKGQSQRLGKKTIISFNYICDQSEVILDDYNNQINCKATLKKIIVIYG